MHSITDPQPYLAVRTDEKWLLFVMKLSNALSTRSGRISIWSIRETERERSPSGAELGKNVPGGSHTDMVIEGGRRNQEEDIPG